MAGSTRAARNDTPDRSAIVHGTAKITDVGTLAPVGPVELLITNFRGRGVGAFLLASHAIAAAVSAPLIMLPAVVYTMFGGVQAVTWTDVKQMVLIVTGLVAAVVVLVLGLVVLASEDVGMADPNALLQCLAAKEMYDFLGSPEGEIGIVQACLYLATAPKSNAAYIAQKKAWATAKETGSLAPPMHILNAPTKLMKQVGYGKGYAYDHDADEGFSGQDYWPEEMEPQSFYQPTDRGFEARVKERLDYWNERRKALQQSDGEAG